MLTEAFARTALHPMIGLGAISGLGTTAAEDPVKEMDIAGEVLRALATMARASKRQQAELQAALERAGLNALPEQRKQAALRELCDSASIEDLIPLDDGGVLISVTSAGMERALR